jgi:hypothetical protein
MSNRLDVHCNPGQSVRAIPFVVVAQSNRFRASTRRVIVPLLETTEFGLLDSDIGPHFEILGRTVVFDSRQITHVPRGLLLLIRTK